MTNSSVDGWKVIGIKFEDVPNHCTLFFTNPICGRGLQVLATQKKREITGTTNQESITFDFFV